MLFTSRLFIMLCVRNTAVLQNLSSQKAIDIKYEKLLLLYCCCFLRPGLQLMMFLQVDEYLTGIAQGYGLRVTVNYPKTMPFPSSDGMFVSAGMETDVGVKMVSEIYSLFVPLGLNIEFLP